MAGLTVTGAGLRQLEKLSMSVRSDIAHVHPRDRTDISIEGNTIAWKNKIVEKKEKLWSEGKDKREY